MVAPEASAKTGNAHRPEALNADRLHSAYRSAGGSGAEQLWHFPVSSAPRRRHGDRIYGRVGTNLHADDSPREMLRQIVLAIRVWRPDVILADAPNGTPARR